MGGEFNRKVVLRTIAVHGNQKISPESFKDFLESHKTHRDSK